MPLTKRQKEELVKNLSEKLTKEKATIFFDFTGLNFNKLQSLRKNLKNKKANLQIIKKTLLNLALKKAKRDIPIESFSGSVAIATTENEEMTPYNTIYSFSKTNKEIKILGGIWEKKFIKAGDAINLAKLPNKEELIGNFVGLLQNNIRSMIYILTNVKK